LAWDCRFGKLTNVLNVLVLLRKRLALAERNREQFGQT
jgi:hypothetical protein